MSIFKKKKDFGQQSVLTDHYVPASLPTEGYSLENFITSDYPMNSVETIEAAYHGVEAQLESVIATCDHHSSGNECDSYIDAAMGHIIATHEAAIPNNENQITRIQSAREMRKAALDRKIIPLQEKVDKLRAEIEPLESLHAQFQLTVGSKSVSLGLLITVLAMVVDAAVNFSFLQGILLSNAALLWITVACMSVMSDGSMFALGTFLSRRKEQFTSKPMFWTICIGMGIMFLLSVVTSVMIRWGSMDATYGTINAAGEFVGKASYSLAEYGVTLLTAFVTTATGLLSFAFSLDENEHLVTVREHKREELEQCIAEMEPLLNERALLENAPDPKVWDALKRQAAEKRISALPTELKLHCRKMMAVRVADPDFSERMADSAEKLMAEEAVSSIPAVHTTNTISFNKAC